MKIAFIGLGVMGGPMASNLVHGTSHDVSGFDLDHDKLQALKNVGALAASTAQECVKDADVVMTSLPGPKQISQLMFAEGLLSHFRAGAVWIDLSTNNLATCNRIVDAAREQNVDYLDAPVSGGDEGARAGSLTIMVGGPKPVYEKVLPLLQKIGADIKWLGPNGAGYSAKIAQVLLCYLHSLALSEALMLGIKGGVEHNQMLSIIQNSTGRSYVADRYGPAMLDGSYDPSFTLGLALKDLHLAMEMAQTLGLDLPLCELTSKTYSRAVEQYGSDANHLKAVKLLEEDNATPLQPLSHPPTTTAR